MLQYANTLCNVSLVELGKGVWHLYRFSTFRKMNLALPAPLCQSYTLALLTPILLVSMSRTNLHKIHLIHSFKSILGLSIEVFSWRRGRMAECCQLVRPWLVTGQFLAPLLQPLQPPARASWRRGSVVDRLPGPVRCHHHPISGPSWSPQLIISLNKQLEKYSSTTFI